MDTNDNLILKELDGLIKENDTENDTKPMTLFGQHFNLFNKEQTTESLKSFKREFHKPSDTQQNIKIPSVESQVFPHNNYCVNSYGMDTVQLSSPDLIVEYVSKKTTETGHEYITNNIINQGFNLDKNLPGIIQIKTGDIEIKISDDGDISYTGEITAAAKGFWAAVSKFAPKNNSSITRLEDEIEHLKDEITYLEYKLHEYMFPKTETTAIEELRMQAAKLLFSTTPPIITLSEEQLIDIKHLNSNLYEQITTQKNNFEHAMELIK